MCSFWTKPPPSKPFPAFYLQSRERLRTLGRRLAESLLSLSLISEQMAYEAPTPRFCGFVPDSARKSLPSFKPDASGAQFEITVIGDRMRLEPYVSRFLK